MCVEQCNKCSAVQHNCLTAESLECSTAVQTNIVPETQDPFRFALSAEVDDNDDFVFAAPTKV